MKNHRTTGLNQLGPIRSAVGRVGNLFNYIPKKKFQVGNLEAREAFHKKHGIVGRQNHTPMAKALRMNKVSRRKVTLPSLKFLEEKEECVRLSIPNLTQSKTQIHKSKRRCSA